MVRAGAAVRSTDASGGAVRSLRVAESTTGREPRPTGGNRAGVAAPWPHHDTEPLLVGHLARIQPADGLGPGARRGRSRAASLASAAPCRAPGRTAARSCRCADGVSPDSGILLVPRADRRRSALRASAGAPSDAEYVVAGGPRVVRGDGNRLRLDARGVRAGVW